MTQKTRTFSDIQQEYQNAAVRAGHLQYQIFTLKNDLAILNSTMRDLNSEAPAAKQAADELEAAEAKASDEASKVGN